MCTSFTIGDQKSGYVYGRTLEFTLPLHSSLVVAPKGLTFTGTDKAGNIGVGGIGRDVLVGGTADTLINATDGKGGDRVICRSSANRVLLDAGDVTTGPCTVIAAG